MLKDFRCKYLGIMIPDCNMCSNLYVTEYEQNRIKETEDRFLNHWCTKYQRRVIHNIPRNAKPGYHNPFIFPCRECHKDDFGNFERRE